MESGDPPGAEKAWRQAFDLASSSCYPLAFGAADYLFDQKQYEQSFRLYNELLFTGSVSAVDPDHEKAIPDFQNGLRAAGAGRFDDAIRDWTRAVKLDPEFQEASFLMGNAAWAKGDLNEARADWRHALSVYGPASPLETNPGPSNVAVSALRVYELFQQ